MFKRAERKKAKLRLGISGPSGSGKTYSALLIAMGLGGKIALIDTEHGSGELYAHLTEYDTATLSPPFTTEKYIEVMKAAAAQGYSVLIIDSISHAWAGEGGLLEQVDKIGKVKNNKFTAWGDITPKHNSFIEAILQSPCHIIATMRSKVDYVLEVNDKGKQVPRKLGLAPIQREGVDFEFTTIFDLQQDSHLATVSKDRTSLFDNTPFLPSKETGATLLNWLETGIDAQAEEMEAEAEVQTQTQALVTRIESIKNIFELRNWRKKHADEVNALAKAQKDLVSQNWEKMRKKLEEVKS